MVESIKSEPGLVTKIWKTLKSNLVLTLGVGLLVGSGAYLYHINNYIKQPSISQNQKKETATRKTNYPVFNDEWVNRMKGEIGVHPKLEKCDVWYVQVGAYQNIDKAREAAKKFKKIRYGTKIESKKNLHKVLVKTYNHGIAEWLKKDLSVNYGRGFITSRREQCERYERNDLEKIVSYFARQNDTGPNIALAITEAEAHFDPNAVAYQLEEIKERVYDKKTGKIKTVIILRRKKDKNGNDIVTALGLMQTHEKHRHNGYNINIDQSFNPIINAYMGNDLIREHRVELRREIATRSQEIINLEKSYGENGNSRIRKLKDINKRKEENIPAYTAFMYHTGERIYKNWNGNAVRKFMEKRHIEEFDEPWKVAKQYQTKNYIRDVLKYYSKYST